MSKVLGRLRKVKATINKYKAKSISIALSTGVDSNVILCLIRDEFPDLEINCITVSFDESSEANVAKKNRRKKFSNFP